MWKNSAHVCHFAASSWACFFSSGLWSSLLRRSYASWTCGVDVNGLVFWGKPVPPRHSFLFWAARHSSEEHLCHWRLCCWHAIDPIYQSPLDGGIYWHIFLGRLGGIGSVLPGLLWWRSFYSSTTFIWYKVGPRIAGISCVTDLRLSHAILWLSSADGRLLWCSGPWVQVMK